MEIMLVKNPTKTRRQRLASHSHQNKQSFPKKPNRGGMLPKAYWKQLENKQEMKDSRFMKWNNRIN